MDKIGDNIKIKIWGKSHDDEIGASVTGLPKGLVLDWNFINSEMERRKPGKNNLVTSRKEEDKPIFTSGIKNNKLDGKELSFVIKNTNHNSSEYKTILRPNHADWTSLIKYKKVFPGGGQFSARLTAPIVLIGAIVKQILKQKGISITSKITSLYNLKKPTQKQIATLIEKMKNEKDSIGGTLQVVISGNISGIGSDYFGSVESKISQFIFSIPGVKGISFGDGFDLSNKKGSEVIDEIYIKNKKILSKTNHMGGILGGISNGMPIVVNIAFKPTPTIGKKLNTIDFSTMKKCVMENTGRHDPSIIIRGQVVAEEYIAIALYDLLLSK